MSKPILTDEEVLRKGREVLVRELGLVDFTRFVQRYSNGRGDYTAEREERLKGLTLEQILAEIQEKRAERGLGDFTAERRNRVDKISLPEAIAMVEAQERKQP